jgi:hypothetical protein
VKPVGLAMVVFGLPQILFRGPFSRLDMRLHDWIHRRIPAVYAIPGMRHRVGHAPSGVNDSHLRGLLRYSRSGCRGLGVVVEAERASI